MDDGEFSARRSSSRARKVAPKMGAALLDSNTRAQAALARLEALEKDNAGAHEPIDLDDDDEASPDEDEQRPHPKKQAKGSKRKTRQAKALERVASIKKAPRSFLDLLQEANLEALPPNVPSYLRAAVGPPSVGARRHFCSVCGYLAPYTCTVCGARFCCSRCQTLHIDTRCQKFLA
ncbi:unnamed protein product [Sphagnum troendelagicum]|uniref:HIT-type domain-containing protein n=1 Tax=Sphagnum troendelagicum TaxID=128251 RepID=A0ABP0UDV4_9BRYO